MNLRINLLHLSMVIFLSLTSSLSVAAQQNKEYFGQFDTALAANIENFEKVIFKSVSADRVKSEKPFSEAAHLAVSRLYSPETERFSVLAILVEEDNEKPVIYVDLNGDNSFGNDEKFAFQQEKKDSPYLWQTMVKLPVKNNFFTSSPLFLRYFKRIKIEKMTVNDRLITQSTDVLARGKVNLDGKKLVVQYAYNFADRTINPQNGWQGVDTNEDGEIDMDELSCEAANAANETVIFRVGQLYLSTKNADLKKNQIILREHKPQEYRRIELQIGKEMPDFSFIDLMGKNRKLSEFRGKFVLLDFWGMWCPPCLRELPFLRDAYNRFRNRNLEIVGMNTDKIAPQEIKTALDKYGLAWTQAQLSSFKDLMNLELRIESFPTTFLISPEGKILSMSRSTRGELDLRGEDLLETLDKILPR